MKILPRALALFLACATISGCAAAAQKMKLEDLADNIDLFHQHLRWKRCKMATPMVGQELQSFFMENCEDLTEGLGIEESTITSLIINEDKTEATARIRFVYYQLPRNNLTKKSAMVTWRKNGTAWQLVEAEGAFFDELFEDELKKDDASTKESVP